LTLDDLLCSKRGRREFSRRAFAVRCDPISGARSEVFLIDLLEVEPFVVERIDQLTASLHGFAGLTVVAESIGHCGNWSTGAIAYFA